METTAEQIQKHIDKFTEIWIDGKEANPMPDDVKLTVWCESRDDEGFAFNQTVDELGFSALIARKWILQDELMKLLNGDT